MQGLPLPGSQSSVQAGGKLASKSFFIEIFVYYKQKAHLFFSKKHRETFIENTFVMDSVWTRTDSGWKRKSRDVPNANGSDKEEGSCDPERSRCIIRGRDLVICYGYEHTVSSGFSGRRSL